MSPLIVALDYDNWSDVEVLLAHLDPARCRVKIGSILFTRYGPWIIEQCQSRGFEVFLDLKFHDIPNTMLKSIQAAASLSVWMLTVHASAGVKALSNIADWKAGATGKTPLIVAVTVLTSMSNLDFQKVGYQAEYSADLVARRAKLALNSGLDGVVCSPLEVAACRNFLPDDALLVTPGIRWDASAVSGLASKDKNSSAAARDDQQRFAGVSETLHSGANYLVVGRPISQSSDPGSVLDYLYAEMGCSV